MEQAESARSLSISPVRMPWTPGFSPGISSGTSPTEIRGTSSEAVLLVRPVVCREVPNAHDSGQRRLTFAY